MHDTLLPAPTRRRLLTGAMCATALASSPAAFAQAISGKPLRVIAPGAPGGGTDLVARLLSDGLQKELKQPVVVDLKPGGGGAIAVNELMQAPRDGSTMMVAISGLVSEVPHIVKLRFDVAKEVKPIAELTRFGLVLVANPAFPAKNLAELIAHVKANPGKVSYASYSTGTISHLAGMQLNRAAGIDLTHVGYKSSQPGLTDVMGGHVPLMFDGMSTALPLIKSGKLKALAVSLPQRSASLPDVPTFRELGYPDLENVVWFGAWVTPDMPAEAQARLRQAALKVLEQPAMRERLQEMGFAPGTPRTPEELQRSLQVEYERTGQMLRAINFKPE